MSHKWINILDEQPPIDLEVVVAYANPSYNDGLFETFATRKDANKYIIGREYPLSAISASETLGSKNIPESKWFCKIILWTYSEDLDKCPQVQWDKYWQTIKIGDEIYQWNK